MAELILSFVVDETLSRVLSLISDEINLAWNGKDLKELQKSFQMIRAVLQDAEEQQTKREPVRLWLEELKDLAYEAEDVLMSSRMRIFDGRGGIMAQTNLDRMTDSILDNPVMGREADFFQIVNLLSSCDRALTIVPIVGMGGLGKTTLAKLVREQVVERKLFDVKIWVCVSDNFNEQRILGEMLQTLKANAGGMTNRNAMLEELGKAMEGKKIPSRS
ncbi:hypothetical protein GH714_014256 [Hevea brasiliensis]|uniref:NB-ARC domain-containing protein n=1 Tax=Hevea brasiliensis TaxID=3981 RepID=A0A6A6N1P4_HEVBR|nr:hypothetical protein GH714_014256 [Hevea brasiliensis]